MFYLDHARPFTDDLVPDEQLRNWPLAAAATWALESIPQEQADIQKSEKTLAIIIMSRELYKKNASEQENQ